ncbi:helix-turn-helix domain-containing protein, partial [Roseomonas gilardii]|uniref:helix-turn-helix domain-containing protein n=1 Tax=Roseomonas gilardii TaxID=257708 RepID=UPI0011A34153
ATIPDEDAPASPLRPKLLTAAEVAAVFRRSERALRDWVRRGYLVPVRVGRSLYFREEEVRALLSGQMRQGLLQVRRERAGGAGTAPAGSAAMGAPRLGNFLK